MNEKKSRLEQPAGKEKWTLRRLWKEWGDVVIILAVIFVVFRFVLQVAWVPSGSMETTIPTKSAMICWRLPFTVSDPVPERGDIITFWSNELDQVLVKRVIGLPGDKVSFYGGYVIINDELLDEEGYLPALGITECDETFVVPEGCVFFLGDNRTGSLDARFWADPYVPVEALQARPFLVISIGRDQCWQGVRFLHREG